MDWNLAIERNREALKRIVAMLVAMAGLGGLTSPLAGEDGSARRGKAEALVEPGEGVPTLPRHLHRAIMRLLRPAEFAVRRLIIVAARGLVAPLARPRKPKRLTLDPVLRGFGIAVVMSPSDFMGAATAARRAAIRAGRPSALSLPLFDPLPGLPGPDLVEGSKGRDRRRYVPAHAAPRISFPGFVAPSLIVPRRPPASDDPLDATRLSLRLAALGAALDDLPGQARRFARWRARKENGRVAEGAQDRNRTRRVWPLRPGRPPGQRHARRRVEVHEILHDLHGLAFDVLDSPDTS